MPTIGFDNYRGTYLDLHAYTIAFGYIVIRICRLYIAARFVHVVPVKNKACIVDGIKIPVDFKVGLKQQLSPNISKKRNYTLPSSQCGFLTPIMIPWSASYKFFRISNEGFKS